MQPKSLPQVPLFPTGRLRVPPAALLGLALVLGAGGCRDRVETTPAAAARPFQGVVVRVSCPGEPTATVVQRYGQAWASQNGARLEVVRYDPPKGPRDGPAADAWVIPPPDLAHYAAPGELLPVPAPLTEREGSYQWGHVVALYRDKLLAWGETVQALPLLGEGFVCFYRADLLGDEKHRAAFRQKFCRDLTPPESWQEYTDLAEYFHGQTRPGIDRPCPSLPALPAADADLDREFYTVAAPFARRAVRGDLPRGHETEFFSFHYDLATGAPRVATPGFVHALELLRRWQAFRPAGTAREPPAAFEAGEAVLCLAEPAWGARFQNSARVRDRFGLCPVPGSRHTFAYDTGREEPVTGVNRVPYLGAGGWLAVVPKTSAHAEAAFSLLAFLSGPQTSRDIVIEPAWGGGVFRRDQLETKVGWQSFGLKPGLTEALVNCLRQTVVDPPLLNPVLCLRTPDQREHREALVAEVRPALAGSKDAGKALAEAAARWQALDARKDAKVWLAEYRTSLGLRPQ